MKDTTVPVETLIAAFRTMRKWGFAIQQDSSGKRQSPDEQFGRAKTLAIEMMGGPSNSEVVDLLAHTILNAAAAREDLAQFR